MASFSFLCAATFVFRSKRREKSQALVSFVAMCSPELAHERRQSGHVLIAVHARWFPVVTCSHLRTANERRAQAPPVLKGKSGLSCARGRLRNLDPGSSAGWEECCSQRTIGPSDRWKSLPLSAINPRADRLLPH